MPGIGALIFRGSGASRRILLVERAGQPLKGYWSLPGGLVETGERLEEAVRREVLEETGLHVKPTRLFGIYERIIPDAQGRVEYHFVLFDYVCTVKSGAIQANDDAARVKWIRQQDLDQYQLTAGTREVIDQAFDEANHAARPIPTSLLTNSVQPRQAVRKRASASKQGATKGSGLK